jgi:hypothetical protein
MLKAAEMHLTGTYQGKNLYVQNPSASGDGFCVHEVHVNGEVTTEVLQPATSSSS